jgi:hypothetical protein
VRQMLTAPTPTPDSGGGVVGPLLRDPGGNLSRLVHHAGTLVAGHAPPVLAALAAAVLLAGAARRLLYRHRHHIALVDARLVEILTPPEVDPDGAQRLWGNLVGLLRPAWRRLTDGQPHLVWQYAFTPTGATLSLWIPGAIPPGLVERAIESAWPAARTRTVRPAPDPIPTTATATGGTLRLHRAEVLPLRIDAGDDAVTALLGAATGLAATERAAVQVLARPVTGRRTRAGHRAAQQLRAGRPLRSRTAGLLASIVEFVVDVALLRPTRPSTGPVDPGALDTARAVLGKAAGPQYEVAVRYAAADTTPTSPRDPAHRAQTPRAQTPRTRASRALARAARDRVRGRVHALASVYALYTGHNGFTRRRLRHPAQALTDRRLDRGQLMSVPELAALARLPADPTAPGIRRAGARSVPPPPDIPTAAGLDTGSAADPDVRVLGDADSGPRRPVAVDVPALRHHTHLVGATGSGKTTLIVHLAVADARHHRGLMVLDSRDTVPELAAHLDPADRRRAILIDPDRPGPVPVLNPLDVPADDAERAVDNICAILHRIYAASWGPRTDDILACCCHTLLTDRYATGRIPSLADIPRLLTDTTFRHRATAHLTDRDLTIFWRWYTDLTDVGRAQAIGPVLNKLRAFLRHRFARRLLTGASTLTLTDILDGGILLARLPKGLLGDDGARLLGSFLMGAAWHAATARAHHPEHTRHDAAIYLDEAVRQEAL